MNYNPHKSLLTRVSLVTFLITTNIFVVAGRLTGRYRTEHFPSGAMSRSSSASSSFNGCVVLPPIISARDKNFLDSVYQFIQSEQKTVGCPGNGPDEQRYIIHSVAFDKVIEHATVYKSILTSIKQAYDDCIGAVRKGHKDATFIRGKLKTMAAEPTTLTYSIKRAAQLQERIEIIKKDSAELDAQILKIRESRKKQTQSPEEASKKREVNSSTKIPGLTFEESLNPEALTKHLEYLEGKLTEIKQKKNSNYVPLHVKAEVDHKMKQTFEQREELAAENEKLRLRYRQMKLLADAVSSWERSDGNIPLLEFMSPTLKQASELKVTDAAYYSMDSVGFEEDDPLKIKASELLLEYIERFLELFEGGHYEAAAFHAANSPHGVLRNSKTMKRFKAITEYKGKFSPQLLFFQALMISSNAVKHPPDADMSVEGVQCALKHNCLESVVNWVTQKRLTYSEKLAEVLCEFGESKPEINDTCLALAQLVYTHCALHREAALCLCKRGMIHGAIDYVYHCKKFNMDDCLYLLKHCQSPQLLQSLTHKYNGVLEQTILNDVMCTPEGWNQIAKKCENNKYSHLAKEIINILSAQAGVVELSNCAEDAKLVEHIFM
ncbi:clathrin heavy chain linker domain-containing protein 1-like isoform X3 [Acipenser ruthenus]|uniref:clathrin heavy chain linker domain-containing protein 1-like isoform X3 n=1 Tax=Acipenser ruthenus TaxID=7906 RepID=UPI0027408C59|nr:clathrin heavy chain linker domain-containing protein 1-like isoform X3 [Acipenser ruthenus]